MSWKYGFDHRLCALGGQNRAQHRTLRREDFHLAVCAPSLAHGSSLRLDDNWRVELPGKLYYVFNFRLRLTLAMRLSLAQPLFLSDARCL